MLISCELYVSNGEDVRTPKGFVYCGMDKIRQTIDTDLFDFFTGVCFTKNVYEYPYPNTCRVYFKEGNKYPITMDVSTLMKIREKLSVGVVSI